MIKGIKIPGSQEVFFFHGVGVFEFLAEKVGQYFKLSPFVIGVFIMGIGTSLPELVSALFSVQKGVSQIIPGNILGANIANILLILGVVAAFSKKGIELSSRYIMIDLHYLLGTALLFILMAYDGQISTGEGVLCLMAFLIHTLYLLRSGDIHDSAPKEEPVHIPFPVETYLRKPDSAVGIYFSGEYTVTSLEKIALALEIPAAVISLTLLSLGTTLPELAVSFILIRKNQQEEAVGNVLGSCIFNATMIPGIASMIGVIDVPNELLALPVAVFLGATIFFYLLTHDKKISTWEGMLFILFYAAFLLKTAGVV